MIRFSAVLVAVAIGVLIGGVATSKLLLVYIAIAVSAVALVALAIGVVLKREELFGEGQALVPAGTSASPGLSAYAGAIAGAVHDQVRPSARVAPPPPVPGAAGYGTSAFGQGAFGQGTFEESVFGQSADSMPPWQPMTPRDPWSWRDTTTSAATPSSTTSSSTTSSSTTPGVMPGDRAGGWGAQDADDPGYGATRRPTPGRHTAAPAAEAGSGLGSAPPSWFGGLGKHAAGGGDLAASAEARTQSRPAARPWELPGRDVGPTDETPATTPTPATGSGSGWSWSSQDAAVPVDGAVPGDTAVLGDTAVPGDVAVTDDVAVVYDTAVVNDAAGSSRTAEPDATATPADITIADDDSAGDADDDWPTRYSWLDDDEAEEIGEAGEDAADTDPGEPDGPHERDDSGDSAGLDALSEPDPETEVAAEAAEAGSEPPAGDTAGADSGSSLVTVVPGVPRYHEPDCILIRFMPDDDIRKLTIPQARATGCTPCTACQPEG